MTKKEKKRKNPVLKLVEENLRVCVYTLFFFLLVFIDF